jgi:hypothetical protein
MLFLNSKMVFFCLKTFEGGYLIKQLGNKYSRCQVTGSLWDQEKLIPITDRY